MNLKLVGSAATALLALTACGAQGSVTTTPTAQTFTMSGQVFVVYNPIEASFITGTLARGNLRLAQRKEGSRCTGSVGGHEDIRPGVQVTVTDEKGTVVGASALEAGKFITAAKDKIGCTFAFTVANVPLSRAFYGVAVARQGIVQFTPETAMTPILTLGS